MVLIDDLESLKNIKPAFKNAWSKFIDGKIPSYSAQGESKFKEWLDKEYGIRYRVTQDRKDLVIIGYRDENMYLTFLLRFS